MANNENRCPTLASQLAYGLLFLFSLDLKYANLGNRAAKVGYSDEQFI